MLECLILGDSLAVGVGQIRTECVTHAESGINSYDYFNRFVMYTKGDTHAKTAIISLGSNDPAKLDTYEELDNLRSQISAERVYWIIPNIKESKRKAVWLVAKKYNDNVIDARDHKRSADHVHPTYAGYKSIAAQTK